MDSIRRRGNTWALVLAAGSGTRLHELTRLGRESSVPKQYCSLTGGPSLLRDTLSRAARIAPPRRTVVVVAAEHRLWWKDDLTAIPAENVVVQPANRGTAVGVLLPLLEILRRDPEAAVVMLPSDHFVADEAVLEGALRRGLEAASRHPEEIVLLGIEPDAPDTEYGWIVPGETASSEAFRVRSFVEKPPRETAERLLGLGGVWNSFLVVARGRALEALYLRRRPSLLGALRAAPRGADGSIDRGTLARTYESLPVSDFSRDLLQRSERWLRVVPVPYCGWSDLGTPARLLECVFRRPKRAPSPSASRVPAAPVVLAESLARARQSPGAVAAS